MRDLKKWFCDFTEWIQESGTLEYIKGKNNNIGISGDVTLINFYLFIDKEEQARNIVEDFPQRRLYRQINEDGKQLKELTRANAFSYSLGNLKHIIDFCYLVRYWNLNFYQEHHLRIDAAFNYLGQYINSQMEFPYQQQTGWKECKLGYEQQMERLKKLN